MNSRDNLFGSLENLGDLDLEQEPNLNLHHESVFGLLSGNIDFGEASDLNHALESDDSEPVTNYTEMNQLLNQFIDRYNALYYTLNDSNVAESLQKLATDFRRINRDELSSADALLIFDVVEFLLLVETDFDNPDILDELDFIKVKYNRIVLNQIVYFDLIEEKIITHVRERQNAESELAELNALRAECEMLEETHKGLLEQAVAVLPKLEEKMAAISSEKSQRLRELKALMKEVERFERPGIQLISADAFNALQITGDPDSDDSAFVLEDFFGIYSQKKEDARQKLEQQLNYREQITDCIAKCREEIRLHHLLLKPNVEQVRATLTPEVNNRIEEQKKSVNPHLFFGKSLQAIFSNYQHEMAKSQTLTNRSQELDVSIEAQQQLLESSTRALEEILTGIEAMPHDVAQSEAKNTP